MEEKLNTAAPVEETEEIEYEDVKRMPVPCFVAVGFAFGLALGISAGNFLPFGNVMIGMAAFLTLGIVGGLIFGIINKYKKKPQ